MDILEARRNGIPLVIERLRGADRLLAEVFAIPGGFVLVEAGWPQRGTEGLHVLAGECGRGRYGWSIAGHDIRVPAENEALHAEWEEWVAWRNSAAGAVFDRGRAWQAIRRSGLLNRRA